MAAKTQPTADAVNTAAPADAGTASDVVRQNTAAETDARAEAAGEARSPGDVATGVADPAPATTLEQPSGAIIETAIVDAVDVSHEAIDANPRAGTTALQNAIDLNDAKRANPVDPDFAGQGIDLSVYGTPTDDGVAAATAATKSDRKA